MSKFKCAADLGTGKDDFEPKSRLKCAPGKELLDGSCFTVSVLLEMAQAYNKANPKRPIVIEAQDSQRRFRKYLLQQLANRFKKVCDDELCWIKQDFIKLMHPAQQQEASKMTHRPKGPKDSDAWLSTVDIEQVLMQYERMYPDFYFLGATPMDFKDLNNAGRRGTPFKGFPITYIESLIASGKTKIGVVFNTDTSRGPGQHWISAFVDAKKGLVCFFDSASGKKIRNGKEIEHLPTPQVTEFLESIKTYFESQGLPSKIESNQVRHQFKNSECGVYSINFILRMLENGGNFHEIADDPVGDDLVNKCRRSYFS